MRLHSVIWQKTVVYNSWSFDSLWFNGDSFTVFEIKKKNCICIVNYAENRKMFKTLYRNVLAMVNVMRTCVLHVNCMHTETVCLTS